MKLAAVILFAAGTLLLGAAVFGPPNAWHRATLQHQRDDESDAHRPDSPDEALKFRLLQLEDENKRIPADGLIRAKAHADAMRAAQMERARAAGKPEGLEVARLIPSDWIGLGPGNIGGRIRTMVIHPTNANSMWVGSVAGGIWHSTNAGASWQPVNDFLANLAVSTLVIDPTNANVMYAGTGELFAASQTAEGQRFSPDGLRGLGVFKSTDGGVTWNQLAATNPADATVCAGGAGLNCAWSYVDRLAISPNGTTILAATGTGIQRSTNGGTTWAAGSGVAGNVFDIDFAPNNNQSAIAGGAGAAVCSTDGGSNWLFANFAPGITGRVELAYAPSNPAIVYASVSDNNGDIYRSTNGGQTFNRVSTGSNVFLGANNQGNYDNIIWVDPQDANTIVVGGIDLWRSSNASTANPIALTKISNWQCGPGQSNACAGTSAHADHHMILAAPGFNNTTNKTVYFGNDGGLFRTDDVLAVGPTSGWINLNHNLGITQFYSGVSGPTGILLGGTQDNGTVRASPDTTFVPPYNTQAWTTPVGAGGDGGYVAADPRDPNYLYTEYTYLTISRSSNAGSSVSSISAGIADSSCTTPPCTPPANFIAPFILDPNEPNRMLAGGVSLWRSNDVKTASPPTWSAIKPPVSNGLLPPANVPISAIAVAERNSSLVVVGHNGGQIFMSNNATFASPTWSRIDTAALPKRFVSRLVIDATRSPNWIYATFGGFSPDNVYVTKDLGATWSDITGSGVTGLPDVPVRSLIINPVRANLLYVGTEIGVFASEDAGATWQLPQGGPANVSVDELFWSQGSLAAATHGRGFYITKKPVFAGSGGGSGGGAGSLCTYETTTCNGVQNCTGFWDCPCTWPSRQIPGATDDVFIGCYPVTVRSGSVGPNALRVDGRLDFEPGTNLFMPNGDVANYGIINGGNELRMKNLVNGGFISTGRLWAIADVFSSGTILSSGTWSNFTTEKYPVQMNNLTLSEHGSLSALGILCKGNLFVGPGAALRASSTDLNPPAAAAFSLWGDAHNDGLIDVAGEWVLSTNTATHTFSSVAGQWRSGALTIGDRADPQGGNGTTISLTSDVTLDVTGLADYANASLLLGASSVVTQNGHKLTINSPDLSGYGQFDLGSGDLTLKIPYLVMNGFEGFIGTGTINLTAPGNTYLELKVAKFDPALHLLAGTVDGQMSVAVRGKFTIDSGATLNLNQGSLSLFGDATINGVIAKTSGAAVASDLIFRGSTFTNNGSVSGDLLKFNSAPGAVPLNQTIAGTGAWPSGRLIYFGYTGVPTTVTLANDVTLNWSSLGIWDGSSVNTDKFILTLPCSTTFDTTFDGLRGEIIGNVRRTNVGSCAGPIAFNSRWTTLQFASGIAPSEVMMNMLPVLPPDFSNAVKRTYTITPTGGSGWAATLRLHYLDSELNSNNEAALQLYRNDGTTWNAQGASASDTTLNWVERNGVTQFSAWALGASAPVFVDSDGDGISDSWTNQYFGHPTGQAGDKSRAGDDADGDGMTNAQEYTAGTNPTVATSVFQIDSTAKTASGAPTFTFPSVGGKKYRIEFATTPGTGAVWMLLQTNIAGTGADIRVTDNSATGQPRRFYRVVVLP